MYRVQADGLHFFQWYLKLYKFCEYVKFMAISGKFDILFITA